MTPKMMMTAAARTVTALAAGLLLTVAANAQVVVVANGSPITELDIQQRSRLIQLSSQKAPARQEVIQELIDDRIKISKAKVYGLEVSEKDVDNAFDNMAGRQRLNAAQFSQVLERSGVSPAALKARMRAELTWSSLVRGKFSSTLQVGERDITETLKANNAQEETGYVYTLYPVTVVVTRDGDVQAKRQIAENLRARFQTCNEGLALARGLRDVAVREPMSRSSAELPQTLRQLLNGIEVGRLTSPELTPQGIQMFAVCAKKESANESPAKREAREKLFSQRFDAESKKYLQELRKQAMIEYK